MLSVAVGYTCSSFFPEFY
ncbi:hypothetical protein [Secundilactobacillus collinoides]